MDPVKLVAFNSGKRFSLGLLARWQGKPPHACAARLCGTLQERACPPVWQETAVPVDVAAPSHVVEDRLRQRRGRRRCEGSGWMRRSADCSRCCSARTLTANLNYPPLEKLNTPNTSTRLSRQPPHRRARRHRRSARQTAGPRPRGWGRRGRGSARRRARRPRPAGSGCRRPCCPRSASHGMRLHANAKVQKFAG